MHFLAHFELTFHILLVPQNTLHNLGTYPTTPSINIYRGKGLRDLNGLCFFGWFSSQ